MGAIVDSVQENIEDIYPLSPLQEGILFHSLYDSTSGIYFEQIGFTFDGGIDIPAFESAWQEVLRRHTVLRTAFVWEGLKNPLQIVYREVRLQIRRLNWSDVRAEEFESNLIDFVKVDRGLGFNLATSPLMRLALIQKEEGVYHFIWSHHHIILDGWS